MGQQCKREHREDGIDTELHVCGGDWTNEGNDVADALRHEGV